jgi:hypothetical protein
MRNRRLIALGVAAVAAVSLSGCGALDTIGSLGTEAILNSELGSLASTLEAIPGIDDADYVIALQADLRYTVGVTAASSGLAEDDAQAALAAVTAAFASDTLADQPSLQFWVSGENAQTILSVSDWATFPTEVIPDEIAYLYALQDAAGVDLSMSLSAPSDAEVDYFRNIGSPDLPDASGLAAAREVADTAATDGKGWNFAGVFMDGAIIPVELEPVAVRIAAIEGVSLSWSDEFSAYDLNWDPSDPEHGENFTVLPEWPAVVELMSAVLNSETGFSLLQVSSDGASLALHSGDCGEPEGSEQEVALAGQFAAVGIHLYPGYCLA